ncbi:MAG: hypothetical protein KDD38_11615, partial [Bdellovibrionales bacterium]|nr:hypothetical protein [Bdellovibrionales bacterium]
MNLIKIKKIIVQHEQTDFFNLVWTLAAIVLGWLIIESNFVAHMFMNNDALFQLPSLQNILKNGGPSSVFYRPDIIGGTPVADILGRLPIYDLAAFFGWPVVLTMNLGLMLSQVLVAFLGAKATVSLAKLWGYEAKVSGLQFALIAATFAFMPVVASRVQYGHLDLIYGMLLFSVIASLLLCARAGDLSLTFFTAITIA